VYIGNLLRNSTSPVGRHDADLRERESGLSRALISDGVLKPKPRSNV